MNFKEFVYYYKAIIVSIIASLTDMFLMFELSKANWKEELALGLSSFAGIIIQFFGQKTTSQGKSDLKNSFLRSNLPCEVVFRPKS